MKVFKKVTPKSLEEWRNSDDCKRRDEWVMRTLKATLKNLHKKRPRVKSRG